MLIEFFGLPGSGKSTVSRLVAERLINEGIAVDETTYDIDHRCRRAVQLARKASGLIHYVATRPQRALRESKQIMATGQKGRHRLAKLAANWMFIASIEARRRRPHSLTLLDQGLAQAIWSIGYAASEPDWLDVLLAGGQLDGLMPDAVVWIHADHCAVSERLGTRQGGASLLDSRRVDDEMLARAEAISVSIMIKLRSKGARLLEVYNNKPDDLHDAASKVFDEILSLRRLSRRKPCRVATTVGNTVDHSGITARAFRLDPEHDQPLSKSARSG
jgi:hypothetical protein